MKIGDKIKHIPTGKEGVVKHISNNLVTCSCTPYSHGGSRISSFIALAPNVVKI